MKYYRINHLSHKESINGYWVFEVALCKSWCRDTAYRKDSKRWCEDNPSIGQCAVTALLFHDGFGGRIYSGISDDGIMHFWNRKRFVNYDFTKFQFPDGKEFYKIKRWNRDKLLETGDVAERYLLLRERFLKEIINRV